MNSANQNDKNENPPHLLLYPISLALWFLFALTVTSYYTTLKAPVSLRLGFGGFLFQLYLSLLPFALLTPATFKYCRHLYGRSRTRASWLLAHGLLCVFWYGAANSLTAPFDLAFWKPPQAGFFDVLFHPSTNQFLVSVISFWVIAAAASLTAAFGERHLRESALARIQAQLSDAKLQNLRDKLNPHFLFNSLNAAVAFIRVGENRKAEDMLLALAELMDAALSPASPLLQPLAEELKLLGKVLEIETIRFGPKLQIIKDIDPLSLAVPVPTMLLQPLLENAVGHGIARRTEPGTIRLQTRLEKGDLVLVLDNDLPAETPLEPNDSHGLGLDLTRKRLWEHYGERAHLAAGCRDGKFRVTLRLPRSGGDGK